jgi:hypothetical protein
MAIKAPTLQACLFVATPTSQLVQELLPPPPPLLMMMIKTHSNILDRFFMCLQFFLVTKWAFFHVQLRNRGYMALDCQED